MARVQLEIDDELLQRVSGTAREEGYTWQDYVVRALHAQVAIDNATRAMRQANDNRGDPGE